ncbi:MAG: dTDP-glucose 4,6-dehydratase, partial [Treponema sp.]|nr:dTDP-glucose 4,6-dehydratase [Treponema sp.]
GKRYFFEKADIADKKEMERIFKKYDIDTVVNFAAETHVDRSILFPESFVRTNVLGTYTLLETARNFWSCSADSLRGDVLFHHVSTDEVYGSLGNGGKFSEKSMYNPQSPYSSSKASSELIAMSYFHTYGLPVTISNSSNNYGAFQFPEKFIPLMILNIKENKELPVYGDGKNIRDWIYVDDHNRAILKILNSSPAGEKWNIGGGNEMENIVLLNKLIDLTAKEIGKDPDIVRKKITFIKDRPGHDKRYAVDSEKARRSLGWNQKMDFDSGLLKTIRWYLSNEGWMERVKNGSYKEWITKNYGERK